MFLRWLFKVFPGEMLGGWSLVRPDLSLWILVALASTGASLAPGTAAGGLAPALAAIPLLLLLIVTVTVKFDAAARGVEAPWGDVFERFFARVLLLLAASAASLAMCVGAAIVTRAAVIILMRNAEAMPLASMVLGVIIYITLLARFSFVPFLAVLDRHADLELGGGKLAPLTRLVWPLLASSRMTDGLRWRLAPYVVLLNLGSAVALLPPPVRIPFLLAWQFVQLTAQAVLFHHYRERRPFLTRQ